MCLARSLVTPRFSPLKRTFPSTVSANTVLPSGDGLAPEANPNGNCLASEDCFSEDATEHHYTGKERDTESGNDYFGARYYASSMGRFMSPDPLGFLVADGTNPQSWNFYSYALNNPLKYTDPTGYAWCAWDDGTHDDTAGTADGAVGSQSDCEKQGGTWSYDDGIYDDGGEPFKMSVDSQHPGDAPSDESTASKIADCTIDAGKTLSISNGLAHIPGAGKYLKDGTWGRTVADALGGGNPFTGALDAGKTLFSNKANARAIAQTATGMAAGGPAQGFGALASKGGITTLSGTTNIGSSAALSAPDLVEATAETGVKAGAELAGATAEVGEEAASGVGVFLLAGYGALTAVEAGYCAITVP